MWARRGFKFSLGGLQGLEKHPMQQENLGMEGDLQHAPRTSASKQLKHWHWFLLLERGVPRRSNSHFTLDSSGFYYAMTIRLSPVLVGLFSAASVNHLILSFGLAFVVGRAS
jgi:hypothetical protein